MTGRRDALLVATSSYRHQPFRQLMAPLNDVKSLCGVFADPDLGGFRVSTILNKDAHVILEQVETFCADREPDDTVLLYFSCHGFTSDTGDLFLVARNTKRDRLLSTGVPDTFLSSVLRRCRASTRILILDCCFGGAFNTGLLAKGDVNTVNIKATFANAGSGLVVLTASNARESAFEEVGDGGQRRSVFTRTLVEGISTGEADLDQDGFISPTDLCGFANTRIVTNQSHQTPTITTIGVQGKIFIAKAKPRPPATNLETAPGLGVAPGRRLDLRPWVRVHEAGPDGANPAVAAVTAMETNLAYQGSPVSLSARYIYAKANQLAGLKADAELGIAWDVLPRVLTDFGTVPESVWPYQSGDWKLPKGKTLAALGKEAAKFKARLVPVRSLGALIDELNHGRPVLSGFTVFETTWMTELVAKTGVIGLPKPDDQSLGAVAVTIVDVDEAARALRFAHTWGPSWGDRGFGTMSFDAAEKMLGFDRMWSVELDVAACGRFRWDLTDVRPAPPARAAPAVPAPPPGLAPVAGQSSARGAPGERRIRRPLVEGAITSARKTATAANEAARAPKPSADGLLRIVYDGRLLGASYARLDPATVLRQEGGKASADPAANQVFEALGAFHACLTEAFGRSSWDGHGAPYRAIVHYGRDFDNAFWDGGAEVIVLGDGDGRLMRGFYGLDVVAKDVGNALVSSMTSLSYQGQSGALFTGLSLAVASMVKQHAAGQTAAEADWLVGAGLLAEGVKGRALSDLLHPGTAYDDPGLGADPMVGHMEQYVKTSEDQGGIRINSGIPARAFALAATAVAGPSWQKVGLAWYRAMESPKLTARATFASFAGLTAAAAEDVAVADAIAQAWHDVGVKVTTRWR